MIEIDQWLPKAASGGGELTKERQDRTLWGDEKILYFDCSSFFTSLHSYPK